MKKILLILSLFLTAIPVFSQENGPSLNRILKFAEETTGFLEGFDENTGPGEFSYHSIRTDVTRCLLSRAQQGQHTIEWLTAPVPEDLTTGKVGFVWIAAIDITSTGYSFDVFFNDEKRFEIQSGSGDQWQLDHAEGATLSFLGIEKDQHGDAHGYMALEVPADWVVPGRRQKIRISGQPAGSNTWVIVYQAGDAAHFLQNSIRYDAWLNLEATPNGETYSIILEGPSGFDGKNLKYISDSEKGEIFMSRNEENTTGSFQLSRQQFEKELTIRDPMAEILSVERPGEPGASSKILSKSILSQEQTVREDGTIIIRSTRQYKPGTVKALLSLSGSGLSKGKIYLMNSSHQDIAWMDSPEKCMLERDTMLLTPLFELASKDPGYRFDVEDALMLKEYITRHPEKKPLVREMLEDGRISCGATYIQPYEEMYSGESLARQFYFGARWLKEEFDYEATVYWNVDVPGRTLQMPQLMKKSGVDYLMMSRFERGLYRWYSPDGSYITAYSPGHYADAFRPLQKNFYDAAQYIAGEGLFWEKYYQEASPGTVIPVLSDWDMSPAVDYSHLIRDWEKIHEVQAEDGNAIPLSLPSFRIASTPEFFEGITGQASGIQEVHGERPAIWLYIHGPSHQKALKASREADILLTQAEKFATINALLDNSFKKYPKEALDRAWEAKIYPDHGWGGKNGEITDNLFYRKYLFAKNEGEKILTESLQEISSKIRTDPAKGTPIVVFNSLNRKRSDVVSVSLGFDPGEAFGIMVYDQEDNPVEFQLDHPEFHPDGSLKRADISFFADKIPSIGYTTYYYRPAAEAAKDEGDPDKVIENRFYRISLDNGGLGSIYDKELGRELIDPSKYNAGEVFTMRSEGNGAGEFADVQQPDMEGFDKTGNYPAKWKVVSEGPVFSRFSMRAPIRHAEVALTVTLYHQIKRIDFDVDLLNWQGILYREFRFALPLNMEDHTVAYEVPFGVLEVGKDEMEGSAGERYIYPCRETRPRGIGNWIGAYDDEVSVVLSSSVAVADYIDPAGQSAGPVLQPLLLASRKSCHGEGNEYLQTGNHSFSFSLTSTLPDWKKGYHRALQANEKLLAVVDPVSYHNASLPGSMSFFSTDAPNVLVSTIKKAEEEDAVIIRTVEYEGTGTEIGLQAFRPFGEIHQTSLTEEKIAPHPVDKPLKTGPHSIETWLLR